jgi:single-strand DNA-binding protein
MKNQVQLIGNVGIDPELTNFEGGAKKVRFTLATNEAYSLKSGGKKQKTFWHNLYAWGPTANYIAKSGKKGAQLAITGKLVTKTNLFNNIDAVNSLAEKRFRKTYNISETENIYATGFMFENEVFQLPETILFSDKGITLLYNTYEISSFKEEPIELFFTFEEINKYLKIK